MNENVNSSTITWTSKNVRFGTGDRAGPAYLHHPQTVAHDRTLMQAGLSRTTRPPQQAVPLTAVTGLS